MFEKYFILLFIEFILFHWMEMKRLELVKLETSLNWSIRKLMQTSKKQVKQAINKPVKSWW